MAGSASEMSCVRPLDAWKAPGGGLTFRRRESTGVPHYRLPCGKCLGCRVRASHDWAVRCTHEASMHSWSCFLTLTYDQHHLPDDLSVHPSEWKRFADRLRQKIGPFRYLMCGEYGDKKLRPHYHALLFGTAFVDDRRLSPRHEGKAKIYESETLDEAWSRGFAEFGSVTWQSARYVAGYVQKKRRAVDFDGKPDPRYTREFEGHRWQVHPEFGNASRRPGLGASWIQEFWEDVYPADRVVTADGRETKPPKYYDRWLEKNEPEVWEKVRAQRAKEVAENPYDYEQARKKDANLRSKFAMYGRQQRL